MEPLFDHAAERALQHLNPQELRQVLQLHERYLARRREMLPPPRIGDFGLGDALMPVRGRPANDNRRR